MDRASHKRLADHAAQYAVISERVLREGNTSRPDNTTRVYARGPKRWREWCAEMQFVDGELVSNDKLLLYVDTKVIGRQAEGTKVRKRIRINDAGDDVVPTIGERTIEGEVSAIMSLWHLQYSSPSYPMKEHPVRSEALKMLLRGVLAKDASRKKEEAPIIPSTRNKFIV